MHPIRESRASPSRPPVTVTPCAGRRPHRTHATSLCRPLAFCCLWSLAACRFSAAAIPTTLAALLKRSVSGLRSRLHPRLERRLTHYCPQSAPSFSTPRRPQTAQPLQSTRSSSQCTARRRCVTPACSLEGLSPGQRAPQLGRTGVESRTSSSRLPHSLPFCTSSRARIASIQRPGARRASSIAHSPRYTHSPLVTASCFSRAQSSPSGKPCYT